MAWRPPRIHPVHAGEQDPEQRPASWLPLFSDLVFVAVLVQLGTIVSENVSVLGFLEFAALFFPVWWAWVGLTLYTNRIEVADITHRALTFLQMGGLVVMGLSASTALGDGSLTFTLGFVVARLGLNAQNARTLRHLPDSPTRTGIRDFTVAFGSITLVWVAAALVAPPGRFWLWGIATVLDVGVPLTVGRSWLSGVSRRDYVHLSERFGEFTLIALGESFLKIVIELAAEPVTLRAVGIGALGFSVIVSLWWTYFDDVAGAALRHAHDQTITVAQFGHYVLVVGIVGAAVGVEKVVAFGFGEELTTADAWLLGGSTALAFVAAAVLDSATGTAEAAPIRRVRAAVRVAAGVALVVVAGLASAFGSVAVVVAIAAVAAVPPALDAAARSGIAVPGLVRLDRLDQPDR